MHNIKLSTAAAAALFFVVAPSIPQGVIALPISSSQIQVSWKASTDNVGIAGYNVYQDGKLVVATKNTQTSYTIIGLTPPTKHTYAIAARDTAGNISAESISVTAGTSAYDKTIFSDGPIGFWEMDPKSYSEADMTRNGNTGTYMNGLPTITAMPNGDPAADFNGLNQYLTIPSNPSFSISTKGSLTWEAWIRPDTLQFPKSDIDGYTDFMGKCQNYSPTCEWEGRMYDSTTAEIGRSNRISAYVFNPTAGLGSAADWQPTGELLKTGQWIYVVGEYTLDSEPSNCANSSAYPGSINIWVNGVKWDQYQHAPTGCMSQYDVKPTAKTSPLDIATMQMSYFFKGAIGKVAIYNYLLNQSQIDNHYEAMTGDSPDGSCGVTCSF